MKFFNLTILATLILFMTNCSQEEWPNEENSQPEVYTVKLSLGGDIIQTEESPLSRAETEATDFYGIQVYKDGNYFAYGLFDNTKEITVNLLANGKYTFECTAIKNGKNVLYKTSGGSYHYTYPFYRNSNYLRCNNEFDYTTDYSYSLGYLSSSSVRMSGSSSSQQCREIDRFYGILDNYTPSVNGVVNLELKRVSFGIKLKVSNIIDGKVKVTCSNSYNTFIDVSDLNADYESEGKIYSMENIVDAWKYGDNYTENLTMKLVWTRGVGINQSWTKTITVKRNAMNNIRIKLGADDDDTGVGITPEIGDPGMEEEEIPLG